MGNYDRTHRNLRARWAPAVARGEVICCLCGRVILPATPWDLDHLPGTDQYRGPAHASCNRRDGAVRGNRMRGARRRRWAL